MIRGWGIFDWDDYMRRLKDGELEQVVGGHVMPHAFSIDDQNIMKNGSAQAGPFLMDSHKRFPKPPRHGFNTQAKGYRPATLSCKTPYLNR